MASRTRWTWVWVNSGRWWWTGRPGVLRFMGSQRIGHDWATELNCPTTEHSAVWSRQPLNNLFSFIWYILHIGIQWMLINLRKASWFSMLPRIFIYSDNIKDFIKFNHFNTPFYTKVLIFSLNQVISNKMLFYSNDASDSWYETQIFCLSFPL